MSYAGRHRSARGEFRSSRGLRCGDKRWAHCSLPCNRPVMSPVGSPHRCGCPRKLSTSYYGGCWPDLAPGLGDCWPIPAVMGINTLGTCGPAKQASASEPLLPRPHRGQERALEFCPSQSNTYGGCPAPHDARHPVGSAAAGSDGPGRLGRFRRALRAAGSAAGLPSRVRNRLV